ncbi:tetratricopeptide repeat protein [Maribacter sp. 2307ULW6-5]|uniref:tetratricopeptide repeat protein n=1 Tax=Maribacter sp. 2307ULW6-5 TaxID=3386275 RepID=UPI0039BC9E13
MAFEANERPSRPVTKFESMLKTDDVYFFDAEDFEDIIHHYLNHGKIALAKKGIKIGLQQHPASIALKLLQVEIMVFENDLERAETLLDELQLLDANNDEIYIQRANILSKKDNHQGAVKLLQKALSLTDNSFDVHSLMGMEYLFMDDFKLAKDSFIKCLEHDEEDHASLYNVVYCFEFLEDNEGALVFLNDYLDRHPYSEVAWHQLGKLYYAEKRYQEALSAFDFAIISDDTFLGAYYEKGKVLENLGQYAEAIENYQTTIEIEDPTAQAFLRIGRCYEKLGDPDMAEYYFKQAVRQDPQLDKGWLAITNFHYRRKAYENALQYIEKALNIDDKNANYWKKCAQIHLALKQYDQADFAFKEAVEQGNYDLKTWLGWADALRELEDYGSALEVLVQATTFYPENLELAYKKVGFYLLHQDPISARIALLDALSLDPEHHGLELLEKHFASVVDNQWVLRILAKK